MVIQTTVLSRDHQTGSISYSGRSSSAYFMSALPVLDRSDRSSNTTSWMAHMYTGRALQRENLIRSRLVFKGMDDILRFRQIV